MFQEFDRLFREVFGEESSRIARTTMYDPRKYDGIKVELIDGQRNIYYKKNGEWVEESDITQERDFNIDFDGDVMTLDVSGHIDASSVSASINNGVVDLQFSSSEEEGENSTSS